MPFNMAAARCLHLLGTSEDDDAEKKRLDEEVTSSAFAENTLDGFQKHFPSLRVDESVGETEWTVTGDPKYVLTTDRLLIPGASKGTWTAIPLAEVGELTVRA